LLTAEQADHPDRRARQPAAGAEHATAGICGWRTRQATDGRE